MYALVDGNNFYVSCERIFDPKLKNRPVVVLSNNDGCAIARSNEAKSLGIKMGAPWFQIRHMERSEGLIALSANFELYGDISDRMMSVASILGPKQEIYSIDESFIDLTGVRGDLVERSRKLRTKILYGVGIPTCIGIGQTKTLAKLANHIAKTAERKPGSYPENLAQVCNLSALASAELDAILAATEVGEVWGIGRQISKQLGEAGIRNVQQLIQLDPATVNRRWSVVLERTLRELRGVSCIDLEDVPANKKEIACTRSFGRPVTELVDLEEAVTVFASRAAEKLRRQEGVVSKVMVFIHTSRFRPEAQYSRSVVVPLRRPSADTAKIVQAASIGLQFIYRSGFKFAKAGVILTDLQDGGVLQGELDLESDQHKDMGKLMVALDGLNRRFGRGTVKMASAGAGEDDRVWSMRQERRTPRYTTRWEEIPVVLA